MASDKGSRMPGVLDECRGQLPGELPDDLNVVNNVIDKVGVLKNLPYYNHGRN